MIIRQSGTHKIKSKQVINHACLNRYNQYGIKNAIGSWLSASTSSLQFLICIYIQAKSIVGNCTYTFSELPLMVRMMQKSYY